MAQVPSYLAGVEVDCLTGEHSLLRTDIVMDVGRSLNPAIDIGQVEGAFVQGYGYMTLEEMVHGDQGQILNQNLGSYKVTRGGIIVCEPSYCVVCRSRALGTSRGSCT